jgi:large subunit ribosomal protein L1
MSQGKKFTAAAAKVDKTKFYDVPSAVALVKSVAFAKFNETVEVALRLGVDPKHADQMVRGTVVLPHGTGQVTRVAVVASGEKIKEAEDAGADHFGGDEFVAKIQAGFLEFDALVATPDMMKSLGRLGKVLGPRGLMPNPKAGTVTFEVGKAVRELKAGKIEFRVDKTAIIHVPVGKVSFVEKQLVENTEAILQAVQKARPATAKGKYLKSVTIGSTMGPGVPVDPTAVEKLFGKAAS